MANRIPIPINNCDWNVRASRLSSGQKASAAASSAESNEVLSIAELKLAIAFSASPLNTPTAKFT